MRAAIAAVHATGGGPPCPDRLSSLASRAVLPYPASRRTWSDATTGLVTLQPDRGVASGEDGPERRSLLSVGACAVALDGTIDNREELYDRLADLVDPGHRESSLHLVLAAYQAWGPGFPRHLLGEFALVLRDGAAGVLVAARDPFGVRPLFFRPAAGHLSLGSQLRQLLCAETRSLENLDQEYLADFLALKDPFGDRTAFCSIKRLRASHVLVASKGRIEVLPYWDLALRTAEPGEGVRAVPLEAFRDLFRQAVSVYLDTPGRVWSELSGGLDSSAIVSMAARVFQERERTPGDFEAVTFTWPRTPRSDEREWAEEVLALTGLKGNFLTGEEKFFAGAIEESRYRDDPHFGLLCHPLFRDEADLLARSGVDVLLSGGRAESVVLQENQAPYFLADLVRQMRLGALARRLPEWQRAIEAPYLSLLHAYVWRPLLAPGSAQRKWNQPAHVPSWVAPRFRRRLDLRSRAKTCGVPRRFSNPSTQVQYQMLRRTEVTGGLGLLDWSVEVRYPFLYRPLVELVFSLPWEVKIAPGRDKRLLREGLAGVLPERIRRRRGWKSPTYAAFRTLTRSGPMLESLGARSHLVDLGVFDPDSWRAALHQARHGRCDDFVALTSSMALEYWLRSFFGEPASG